MAFLRTSDFYDHISEANLNQILEEAKGIEGDTEVRASAENKAISKAKEYLTSRYLVKRVFAFFKTFSLSTSYSWGDRIDFTADAFNALTVYSSTNTVLYNGSVYEKNATTLSYVAGTLPTDTNFFTYRGAEDLYFIAFPEDFDSDEVYTEDDFVTYNHQVYQRGSSTPQETTLPTDVNYWTRIKSSEYLANKEVVGLCPNNSEWTQGDNRNQGVVECIVHMTLIRIHSIINPRNIPQLRRDNNDMSKEWLKEVQKGVIEADLPAKLTEQTGYSIRFGSHTQTEHGY